MRRKKMKKTKKRHARPLSEEVEEVCLAHRKAAQPTEQRDHSVEAVMPVPPVSVLG